MEPVQPEPATPARELRVRLLLSGLSVLVGTGLIMVRFHLDRHMVWLTAGAFFIVGGIWTAALSLAAGNLALVSRAGQSRVFSLVCLTVLGLILLATLVTGILGL